VAGRWYGVRGRRFMRPTLTVSRGEGSPPVRALADLDGKPWAAEDGSAWTAAFEVEMTLQEAQSAELSVAPDISVALIDAEGAIVAAGERIAATGSPSSPLAKSAAGRRRPTILGSAATDRVTARLAAAGDALQRERDRRTAAERSLESERERRAAAERALEEERARLRRQQLELGQLRAELELAGTQQVEAGEAATELESTRQQLIAAQRQIEELGRERDRAVRAHAETRTALNERTGALESARQALAVEQAESGRLRSDRERRPSSAGAGRSPAEALGPAAGGRGAAAGSGRSDRPERPDGDAPVPDGDPEPADDPRRVTALLRGADAPTSHPAGYGFSPGHHPSSHAAPRRRSPWFSRMLALLFLIAVIVAIVLVIHSTVA
jgi:hypothetical protein